MASNVQILEHEEETLHSTPIFRPTAGRTPSFSSSISWESSYGSSSHSSNEEFPTFSPPKTHLRFKGIPFSWEQIPGIPKHQLGSEKKEYSYSKHLLPLPPAGNSSSAAKKLLHHEEISPKKSNRFQGDPFFAALVECSKDKDIDHHHGNIWKGNCKNATRRLSDRFGFINSYTSCKSACAVSEAVVYVRPRSSRPHYLLNRRGSNELSINP